MLITCLLFVLAVHIFVCNGSDTLLPGQSLFTNQTLVSKGGKFELGFFSPGNSTNYYLGIWYKRIPVHTVVWVFNRDYPIPHSYYNYSRLEFSSNGTIFVYPGFRVQFLRHASPNASEAVLLDTGNFVLRNISGLILWQSFDFSTDTWLPGMKLEKYRFFDDGDIKYWTYGNSLVSWTSPNDPAPGNYSFQADDRGVSTRFNSSEILWSGELRGGAFASLPDYSGFSISYNFTYISEGSGISGYFMYNVFDESLLLRIVIDYGGGLTHFRWSDGRQAWIVLYSNTRPKYGVNIICNGNYWSPACRCLDGFVPRDKQEWNLSHFPNECVRNTPLECARDKARYINVTTTTLPDNPQSLKVPNHDACNLACSDNCSCTAYAYYDDGGGCLLFLGNLSALVNPPNNYVGVDLYIKTESAHTSRILLAIALIVPISAALIISCFCFFYFMWPKLKNNESRVSHQDLLQLDLNSSLRNRDAEEKNSRYELPVFSFSSIATSTNNFSITNRLGEGGFGPVYKGEVLNGQFVAVKRLSRRSGQGVEEFKNETELIAKLQHINLVGILGCCTENNEMILVYEYMSNKSLDFFLFEPSTKKELLDWQRRVHIITGIAQGLLYLHHYSRIRIVHRDLKASNILLDAEMNPKISDFGMARIFGGNDMQANTKRIVGTYGYMSPEYAMEGLFSMKSDVFAFGVLMLEIMSGKKNTGFYGSDYLSLLGYAWELWKHDSALELMDSMLEIPDSMMEIPDSSSSIPLRLIQISLLCVEENPADRPLISDVVGMLNNERRAIPSPHNPAFTVGRTSAKAAPTHHKVEICSVNDLTVSNVEAR